MKEAYNVYQGEQTTLAEVVAANAVAGHEQNQSLKATEHTEGWIEAFFAVPRHLAAGETNLPIGVYSDEDAPELPANAIVTGVLIETTKAKAGAGTITAKLGSSTLQVVNAAGTGYHATPGTLRSASAQAITFAVTSDVVTAGAARIRISYLRGGPNT